MRPLLSPEAVNEGAVITGIPLTWVELRGFEPLTP